MEVSRMTFTEETKIKLANPMLPRGKKTELRKALVKEIIRSKPAGHEFRLMDFTNQLHYTKNAGTAAWAFIQNMIKNGEITQEKIPTTKRAVYTIPGDSKVIKPKDQVIEKAIDLGQEIEKHKSKESSKANDPCYHGPNLEVGFIESAAKNFVWNTGSFDVREFVNWLKK